MKIPDRRASVGREIRTTTSATWIEHHARWRTVEWFDQRAHSVICYGEHLVFIDPRQFTFVHELEACWRAIREECLALPEDSFDPWVQREMYGEGWSVYGLIAFGTRIEAALARCPRTASAIAMIPGLTTAGFSRLTPGAHIKPHVGWVTTVYRAHLGLIVPDECALRVGDETRAWSEGATVIFDDTTTHEAWNRSTHTRTVLLFDFLRPGCEGTGTDEPPDAVRALIRQRSS